MRTLDGYVNNDLIEYNGEFIFCDDFGTLTEEEQAEMFNGEEDE